MSSSKGPLKTQISSDQSRPDKLHPLDEQVQAGIRGDFKRGWEIAEELKRVSPDCYRAQFNRAWYEMMRGDLFEGLKLLDSGRFAGAFGDQRLPTDKPIYRDENLEGKKLLICGEGGLGDEIINARFAKDFAEKGADVTLTCDPSLMSVFARIKGVRSVVGHRRGTDVYHDYWVPAMSAARVLEYSYEKLSGAPYLSVDPLHEEKWKKAFARQKVKPRIGLKFFGNPQFEHEQHRRFPIDGLIDTLGERPWVSLQLEDSPLPIQSWEDTLAVINQLDLVITSCTSVAHAAGALGKETWVLVPILPYYIWAKPGSNSPWYQSVQLFRQEVHGKWDDVFQKISKELEKNFKA